MYSFKEYVELRDLVLGEYGSESMEWSEVVEKVINDMKDMPSKPNVKFFSGYLAKFPQVKEYMRKLADKVVRMQPYTNQIEKLNIDPKLQHQFAVQVIETMFKQKAVSDSFVKYVRNVLANEPTLLQKLGATAKNLAIQTGKGAVALGKTAVQTGKEIGQGLATGISTAGDNISAGVDLTKAAANASMDLMNQLGVKIDDTIAQMDTAANKWGRQMARQNPKTLGWMAK
jgi:hypothetical protein